LGGPKLDWIEMKTGRIWRHGVWALCVLAVASVAAWAQNQSGSAPAAPETEQSSRPQKDEPHKDENVAEQAADATKKLGETTLSKLTDWENGWLTGPYVGKERNLVSVTSRERWDIYLQQTLTTPSAYIKRMIVAGFDQWRDSPPQWPEGWNGYGERFASREGQFIAANSLANLGNAALRYEPRYDQCKCSGFRLRTRHAILRNFLTYDRYEEKLHPQWALYGGAFGGGVIATSWKPHPRNALAEGGWAVLGQAGYGSLLNFFTEFAGDINRKLGARRQARSGRQSPEK
jgi:hypothetical protein